MNKKISTPIAIGIILTIAVLVGIFTLWQYLKTQKELSYSLPEIKILETKQSETKIKEISIQKPNLVIMGENLSKVQIYMVPTGTEIDPETMSRIENATKQSENNGEQTWIYQYPKDLLITNIFAKGFDNKGNLVGKIDFPIVGATALWDALYTAETANWQTYTNEEYGFKFKYPKNWVFNVSSDDTNKDLDIHLANFQHSDNYGCDQNYIGLEIQNHLKDQSQDFSSFVKSKITQNELEHELGPSGSLEEITVNGRLGFKVQYSGWDSGCSGPGYFIEQDKSHYIYIFTGYDRNNQSGAQDIYNQMLSTFRFIEKPYIKVLSPNGGEKWIVGNTYDITWESKGVDKVCVTISDYKATDSCRLTYECISAALDKYSYNIASGRCPVFTGDKLKIRVWSGEINDESDDYFSIVGN